MFNIHHGRQHLIIHHADRAGRYIMPSHHAIHRSVGKNGSNAVLILDLLVRDHIILVAQAEVQLHTASQLCQIIEGILVINSLTIVGIILPVISHMMSRFPTLNRNMEHFQIRREAQHQLGILQIVLCIQRYIKFYRGIVRPIVIPPLAKHFIFLACRGFFLHQEAGLGSQGDIHRQLLAAGGYQLHSFFVVIFPGSPAAGGKL